FLEAIQGRQRQGDERITRGEIADPLCGREMIWSFVASQVRRRIYERVLFSPWSDTSSRVNSRVEHSCAPGSHWNLHGPGAARAPSRHMPVPTETTSPREDSEHPP